MPKPGDRVRVKTAFGNYLPKRAVTDVIKGDLIEVVRLCSEEEWAAAQRDQREPASTPFPARDVSELTTA